MGFGQPRGPRLISSQLSRSERKELVVICNEPLCYKTEDEWQKVGQRAVRKKAPCLLLHCERSNMCSRGLCATGFIPPQACLSQYGGDWLLNSSTWPYAFPLSRSDFTGLPSQHPPAVLYPAPPFPPSILPHPPYPASLYPFPTPSPISPAGSSLNDTRSIWLIISPQAMPLWPSPRNKFCTQGGAEGHSSSTGHSDCSPRRPHCLWHYQPFTVKFNTPSHCRIIYRKPSKYLHVCKGSENTD